MNKTLVFDKENDQSYGVTCGEYTKDNIFPIGPNPMDGQD